MRHGYEGWQESRPFKLIAESRILLLQERARKWDDALLLWIAAAIGTFLIASGLAGTVDGFYAAFVLFYPWAVWLLVVLMSISVSALVYSAVVLLKQKNLDPLLPRDVSKVRDLVVIIMSCALVGLFLVPFLITRANYFLPGGDAVYYIGMANEFRHYGLGWSLVNDSRPFINIMLGFIITGFGFLQLNDQANYLISTSIIMIGSIVLMVGASFLLLRRNGFDKVTIFVAILLTLSSVSTIQLSNGQYANVLALSLLYLSLYLLDRILVSRGLVEVLLLAAVGTSAALTHIETFGISSLVILGSTLLVSAKLPYVVAKEHLVMILTVFAIEVALLSPFIGLALSNTHYFGIFSTYLGNVHERYFAAFPGTVGAPPPPPDFDRTALLSLTVQYGNLLTFVALTISFPILALKFKRRQQVRSDIFALVWGLIVIVGAITTYSLSIFSVNPNFAGLLLTRRFLFVLPLPFLFSTTADFLRRQ